MDVRTQGLELAKVFEAACQGVPHQQFAIDDAPRHPDALLQHWYHRWAVDGRDVVRVADVPIVYQINTIINININIK
jgi:hypothetical protein